MAAENFDAALAAILAEEGGYVDHPLDPGGATKFGITRATLSAARGRPVSKAEVMALSPEAAAEIYRARYWKAVRGDDLPAGLDLAVFDAAVNSGPSRAIRLLQEALSVPEDGVFGPGTLAAVKAADPARAIESVSALRLAFLRRLAGWPSLAAAGANAWNASGGARSAWQGASMPRTAASCFNPRGEPYVRGQQIHPVEPHCLVQPDRLAALVLSAFGFQTGAIDQNALIDAVLATIAAASFIASTVFRIFAEHRLR